MGWSSIEKDSQNKMLASESKINKSKLMNISPEKNKF